MKLTILKVDLRSNDETSFKCNAIADATGLELFPVISSRENNWILLYHFDETTCNKTIYLMRCQNE